MTVTVASFAFDCADALAVGRFWSAAIGRPLDDGAMNEFASIGFNERRTVEGWGPADEPTWLFSQVPEPKAAKNRVHLDVIAPDLEAEIARLVELGATRVADREQYGYTWTLMTDPEGNEFDIGLAL
jgi:predicted enzyme related to lactoylglutathione lyase